MREGAISVALSFCEEQSTGALWLMGLDGLCVMRPAAWSQSNMRTKSTRIKFLESVAEHCRHGDAYTDAVLRSLDPTERPLVLCSGFQLAWFDHDGVSALPELLWNWFALTDQSLYIGDFEVQPIKLNLFERGMCLVEPHAPPYFPVPEVVDVLRFDAVREVKLSSALIDVPSDGFAKDSLFHESILIGEAYGRDSSLYGMPIPLVEVVGELAGESEGFDFFVEDRSGEDALTLVEEHQRLLS